MCMGRLFVVIPKGELSLLTTRGLPLLECYLFPVYAFWIIILPKIQAKSNLLLYEVYSIYAKNII